MKFSQLLQEQTHYQSAKNKMKRASTLTGRPHFQEMLAHHAYMAGHIKQLQSMYPLNSDEHTEYSKLIDFHKRKAGEFHNRILKGE